MVVSCITLYFVFCLLIVYIIHAHVIVLEAQSVYKASAYNPIVSFKGKRTCLCHWFEVFVFFTFI